MRVRSAARAAGAAVAFLTRLPVEGRAELGAEDVARGTVLFPLVGAAIGAAVGAVGAGLDSRLGVLLAAGLAVAVEAALTGAIHLDALADAADGLGAATPERALAVMREPAIGAFGATALALDLLVKTAAVAAILSGPEAVPAVVAAFALGRAAPLALGGLPYARAAGGTGAALTGARAPWLAAGVALAAVLAAAVLGLRAAWLAAAAALAVAVVGIAARRRVGGVTGDVLGAALELATTAALVAAAASR